MPGEKRERERERRERKKELAYVEAFVNRPCIIVSGKVDYIVALCVLYRMYIRIKNSFG